MSKERTTAANAVENTKAETNTTEKKLTKKQQRVYDFIVKTIREKGYAPTIREISSGLGLQSPATVYSHMKVLEEEGYIARDKDKSRTIKIKKQDAQNEEPAVLHYVRTEREEPEQSSRQENGKENKNESRQENREESGKENNDGCTPDTFLIFSDGIKEYKVPVSVLKKCQAE